MVVLYALLLPCRPSFFPRYLSATGPANLRALKKWIGVCVRVHECECEYACMVCVCVSVYECVHACMVCVCVCVCV